MKVDAPQEPRPRLKRHLSVVEHGADIVELRRGAWNPTSITFTDEAGSGQLLRILRRLDGQLTVPEIAAAEAVPKREVESLLDQLAELGLIDQGPETALDRYLDDIAGNLFPHSSDGQGRLFPIVLVGDENASGQVARLVSDDARDRNGKGAGAVEIADAAARQQLLSLARASLVDGLAFEQEAAPFARWAGRLVVLITSTVNPVEMRGINRVALRHGFPLLYASVDGPFLLVGPIVVPFRTACLECLETRVLMNLREGESYQRYKAALVDGRASGSTAPLEGILGAMLTSLTAFEALNFSLTGASFSVGKVLAVYLPTMEFTWNEVLRVPACSACGSAREHDRDLYFDMRALLDGDS